MEIVVRATLIFWFLWLVTRGMGKRELAEMSPFEMILVVTMGDLVQQAVTQEDFSLTGAAMAVGTLAFWVLASGFVARRSSRARQVLESSPVMLIHDGHLLAAAMRAERVDRDDVEEAARNQGIADLSLVRFGILEPDGKFSFITAEPTGSDQRR